MIDETPKHREALSTAYITAKFDIHTQRNLSEMSTKMQQNIKRRAKLTAAAKTADWFQI